jgi:hypothetical protein
MDEKEITNQINCQIPIQITLQFYPSLSMPLIRKEKNNIENTKKVNIINNFYLKQSNTFTVLLIHSHLKCICLNHNMESKIKHQIIKERELTPSYFKHSKTIH